MSRDRLALGGLGLAVAAGLSLTGVVLPAASAQAVVAPSVALPSLLGGQPVQRSAVAFDDGDLLVGSRLSDGTTSIQTWPVADAPPDSIDLGLPDVIEDDAAGSTAAARRFAVSGPVTVTTTADDQVHVADHGIPVFTVPAPGSGPTSVDASGPYVRIGARVWDIRRASLAPVYAGPASTRVAALYGSYLAFGDATGRVLLKNVASGAAPVLVDPGTPGCTTCTPVVRVDAGTVAAGVPGGQLTLFGVATGTRHPHALSLAGATGFWLGDGALLVGTATGVTMRALTTATTVSGSGVEAVSGAVTDLDVDGNAVAYVGAGGVAYVAHLPGPDAAYPPVLLTATVATAVSPNGDGVSDAWSPELYFTRALTGYDLTIASPSGAVLRHVVGSVAAGGTSIRPTWSPGSSAAVPDGRYPWRLVPTGADGAGPALTGAVRVIRRDPRASAVVVPADLAQRTASTATPVSWKPLGRAPSGVSTVRYDVGYRRVTISRGTRVLGAVRVLRSATTAGSATFHGSAGSTYQFRVRGRDSVGLVGPWSRWSTSSTPLDDRSGRLRYGAGWTAARARGAWAGTEHRATRSGRSVSLAESATSGYALVMTTCRTCGAVQVYVDGRLRRTVGLYSSSAGYRRQVYAVGFARPGRHTIRVVTVTRQHRTRAYLDAILVLH